MLICRGLWKNFELEKALSTERLIGYNCMSLENEPESSEDDGGLTYEISEESKRTRNVCLLFLINKPWIWSARLRNHQ